MSDFSTLLRAYVTEQTDRAQAASLDPASESRVIAWRARRRRAARVGVVVGAAAAVVIVAGAGVFAATRPDPVPPAETHTPVTPTPSESPTEPDAEEPAVDPGAAVNPLLPESQPLEPGMLAAAPPGSVLLDYSVRCPYPCLQPTSDPVLYLVTPDGGVFGSTTPHPAGSLIDWLPGSSIALFSRTIDQATVRVVAVDLDTGRRLGELDELLNGGLESSLVDPGHVIRLGYDETGSFLERVALADGAVVAHVPAVSWLDADFSPDRSRVLITSSGGMRVFDTASLTEVSLPPTEVAWGNPCSGIGWAGADVVAGCPDTDGTRVRRVPLDGGAVTEIGLHPYGYPYELRYVWDVGGRLVLAPHETGGDWLSRAEMAGAPEHLRFALERGGGLFGNTLIDWEATSWAGEGVQYLGATADGVLAAAACEGSYAWSVVVIDPATGSARTVLEPRAPGWGQVEGAVVVPTVEGGR